MFEDRSLGMAVLFVLTGLILLIQGTIWLLSLPLWAYIPIVFLIGAVVWHWDTIRYFFTGRSRTPRHEVDDHQRPIEPVHLYDWTEHDD